MYLYGELLAGWSTTKTGSSPVQICQTDKRRARSFDEWSSQEVGPHAHAGVALFFFDDLFFKLASCPAACAEIFGGQEHRIGTGGSREMNQSSRAGHGCDATAAGKICTRVDPCVSYYAHGVIWERRGLKGFSSSSSSVIRDGHKDNTTKKTETFLERRKREYNNL